MPDEQILLPIIMEAVIKTMVVPGISSITYAPGTNLQIIKILTDFDNSTNYKSYKFPLIAMVLPVPIKRGKSINYYGLVNIPRIIIAQAAGWDGTEDVMIRYRDQGNFKSVLYPCYYELLKRLANYPNVIDGEPNDFEHTLTDHPGDRPISNVSNDFVDYLEINNLEFTLSQTKTC